MYELQMLSHEVKEEIDLYKAKFDNFDEIEDVELPKEFTGTLRHYQQQGLNWLNFLDDFNFGGCLADDMGLGKSAQIIAFILTQRKKTNQNTNLLIVPTSLLFNWQQEIAKFAPSLKLFTHYGSRRTNNLKEIDQYEVILTTYGSILADARFLKEYTFNYIFLDESQLIKNPGSQRYQSVCLLKSRNKIIITGTPLENNTFDLYGQLSFACPGLFGSKQHFRDLYAIPIDRFKDDKRAAELQQKINPFILRRTKKQVAKELPDKTEMVIYCEMEAEQRKIYDVHEKEFREFLSARSDEDIPKSALHVLKGLTTLRQICNSPALVKDAAYAHTSAKMDALMEQIENKSPQHKILIFSQFVSMLNLIKKELERRNISFAYLTGSTRNREEVVDSFQNNSNVRVFLISLKAGGVGLNLTEADYVYLVDPWWNPAVENQAIDRCYRIGQNKKVIAVRLICLDTVEEKIMKMQQAKTLLADDLVRTDSNMLKLFTKDELLNLLK
jgi:SNF2 family DNA or RNA helicase